MNEAHVITVFIQNIFLCYRANNIEVLQVTSDIQVSSD